MHEIHETCIKERSEQVNEIIDLLVDESAKIGQFNIDERERIRIEKIRI